MSANGRRPATPGTHGAAPAGLIAPSGGTVSYRGTPLNGANPGVAMVFQSFALLPWLTVQQNVELAMQASGRCRRMCAGPRRCARST